MSLFFCSNVPLQDLEAIGIKDRGIAQHLEKAAKKLPMFVLEKGIPVSALVSEIIILNYIWLACTCTYRTLCKHAAASIGCMHGACMHEPEQGHLCRSTHA